jgi:hypothetical protein
MDARQAKVHQIADDVLVTLKQHMPADCSVVLSALLWVLWVLIEGDQGVLKQGKFVLQKEGAQS